jgi:hypothetical protein
VFTVGDSSSNVRDGLVQLAQGCTYVVPVSRWEVSHHPLTVAFRAYQQVHGYDLKDVSSTRMAGRPH